MIKQNNKQHSSTAIVTGKAVNPGDGVGMHIEFWGEKKDIVLS